MSLANSIRKFISRLPSAWVPIRRITIGDSRSEPSPVGISMSAERVHSVLESAEAGDTRDLFALYRDMTLASAHLLAEFQKRKLAVINDTLSVQPFDKNNADDIQTAQLVDSELSSVPGWLKVLSDCLDSALYPVTVLEKTFRSDGAGFRIAAITLVPYQLLSFQEGRLQIVETDARGNPLPIRHDPDPARYIIHRGNLLSAPDNWGGPMRSILFWWLLAAMDREWWARFIERYGSPFLIGRYERGDEAGRSILGQAFSLATRLGGLVITRETEVEIKAAAVSDSGDAFEKLHAVANREISKLILGQTLSSDAQPTGLGSGVSTLQGEVRQDIRRLDGRLLCQTLRDQLVVQYCKINKLPGKPPNLSLGSESETKTAATMSTVKSAYDAGLELADDSIATLNERTGLQFQRRAAPAVSPFSVVPFSAQPGSTPPASLDSIPKAGAADLAQAFRGALAPIAQIVRESRSAKECEIRVREFCSAWSPRQVNTLVQESLTAMAANGSQAERT